MYLSPMVQSMFKGSFKIPPGTDINALDGTFRAPVHYAVMHNKIDIFLTLVEAKAVVDTTSMSYAARYSNTQMMECLLSTMPSLLQEKYLTPPLLVAVQHFNTHAVVALLKAGVDPNSYPSYEQSPLMYAVKRHASALASILVDAGARSDEALAYAILHHRDIDLIESLIPATSSAVLNRAPFYAVQHNARLKILKLLLTSGASPDGDKHVCPLIAALSQGSSYTELLLQHGACPFVQWNDYAHADSVRLVKTAQLSILEANRRTEIACFIACYPPLRYTVEAGAIDARFIHPLAHLTWAYGVRPIRKRLVAYLVEKKRRNGLLLELRRGF
jgi:ankyrin repeat protein